MPEVYIPIAKQIQLNGLPHGTVNNWPKNFGHIVGLALNQDELAIEVLLVNGVTIFIKIAVNPRAFRPRI